MSGAVQAKPRGRSEPRSAARGPAADDRRTRPSVSATTIANGGGTPSRALEAAHAAHPDLHTVRSQQFCFDPRISALTSEQPSRGDHAVARYTRLPAAAHDVPDGARRARVSRQRRNVTIGCDTTGRNPPNRRQHAPAKLGHCPTMIRTLNVKPPRSCSSYSLATLDAASPKAFGTTAH